jgi:hypothetical protein
MGAGALPIGGDDMSLVESGPEVTNYALFPTRLVTIQFPAVEALNAELYGLFERRSELIDGFNMHPDALNLLSLADAEPCLSQLRSMFVDGVKHWLSAEGIAAPDGVDLVLFTNLARGGEFTLVHNHNADLVGIYYARTANYDLPPVHQPDDGTGYFTPGDGVLVLHDPRFNSNLTAVGNRDHVTVHPRPGLMLIFPGYLWHSVAPHLGEFSRLSFSMNFTLRWSGTSTAQRHPLT